MDEWAIEEPDILYGESYYAVPGYWEDEGWAIVYEPDDFTEPGDSA